jgi:DNA-binding GntR family transcriptional regulator
VPRYRQIAGIIRGQIEQGQLQPGDRIPSQQQMQDEYAVAKATAAKALKVLVNEGLVVVVPGLGARVARRLAQRPGWARVPNMATSPRPPMARAASQMAQ